MTFDPSANLAEGTSYTAKIGTGAKDAAGNALASAVASTFTTAVTVNLQPGSTAILSGSIRSGDATRLGSDDNLYYQVNSTTSSTYTSAWYGKFTGVSNALTSLKVSYRGMSSRSVTQTVSLYRWTDGAWVTLDSRSVSTSEVGLTLTPTGTLADYVSGTSGDGEVRVRIRSTTTGGTFYTSGDLLRIAFTKPA